jgi:hypothetical protein
MKRHGLLVALALTALGLGFACGGATGNDPGGGGGAGVDAGDNEGSALADGAVGDDGSGAPDPNDPLNAAPKCTSNRTWTNGNRGSGSMHPGVACIACHSTNARAPQFTIAGTVYPSGHEPPDCNGAAGAGVVVVVTDKNGAVQNLTPNGVGNFYSRTAVAMPYTAKVTFQGKERAMKASQSNGDCNSCHTETGANGAPGRITLPF